MKTSCTSHVMYICLSTIQELEDSMTVLEDLINGPYARVVRKGKDGYCLYNLAKSEDRYLINNRHILKSPGICDCTPDITLSAYPSLSEGEVKEIHSQIEQGNPTRETQRIHKLVLLKVQKMERSARFDHLKRRLDWLEDHPYPDEKQRRYWPPFFDHLMRVQRDQVVCMDCGDTPKRILNISKSVWNVIHISNDKKDFTSSTNPSPSTYDQYFQCPHCCGTWNTDGEHILHLSAPMYVVTPSQEYYQPLDDEDTIRGKYLNTNWIAYVEHPDDKPRQNKRKRQISTQESTSEVAKKENTRIGNYMQSAAFIEQNRK